MCDDLAEEAEKEGKLRILNYAILRRESLAPPPLFLVLRSLISGGSSEARRDRLAL